MQEKKHFDYFWDEAILPSIQLAVNEMSLDFRIATSVSLQDTISYKTELESIYRRKREWLKQSYLPHDSEPCLDFHKLAAIICRSIIGLKPIKYDIDAVESVIEQQKFHNNLHDEQIKWFVNNVYVNYKVAFLAAVGVVYANLVYWAYTKQKNCSNKSVAEIYEAFAKLLLEKGCLCSYVDPQSHENFENSMIIALMKNDLLQRDFDYLGFATNLYQLEYYTKLMLFQEALKGSVYTLENIDLS